MALIKCTECGKEVSDKAELCVACGNPFAKQPVIEKTEISSDKMLALEEIKNYKTNHILHLLLSVVTFGFWVIIWVIISYGNELNRNNIRKKYGLETEGNPKLLLFLIIALIVSTSFLI